ncbi:MAG: ribosome maturation factor RimP [Acidimicrobiales bacterium]
MLDGPFEPGVVVRRSVGGQPTLLFCARARLRDWGPEGPRRRGGELQVVDDLFDLLAPTLAGLGLELVDAQVHTGLVRVFVDRPGGADVDAIAEATRAISTVLDEHDPLPGGRYTLEVSSPGVERPLRSAEHFARAVGETVTVRTLAGSQGDRRAKGKLVSADDEGFVLEGEDIAEGARRFSYSEIERARTVFEWPSSSSAPGGRGGSRNASRSGRPSGSRRKAGVENVTAR